MPMNIEGLSGTNSRLVCDIYGNRGVIEVCLVSDQITTSLLSGTFSGGVYDRNHLDFLLSAAAAYHGIKYEVNEK